MAFEARDELDLIQAAVEGRDGAFDGVVRNYAARLRWLIRVRLDPSVRARVSADDVLQDVMITVSARIRSLVIENEGAFWTWLCRVVEQKLIDVRRRHLMAAARDARREQRIGGPAGNSGTARTPESVLADHGSTPSARLRTVEQQALIEKTLDTLPPSFREVILLRVIEGLSVAETAGSMGRSPGAVSVLLNKAMKRFNTALRERESSRGERRTSEH